MTAKEALEIIKYFSILNEMGQDEIQIDFDKALSIIKQTLIEQEKKDVLIDKLYQEELNKPLKKNGKRGYTNSTRLRILKQIKALEEELK